MHVLIKRLNPLKSGEVPEQVNVLKVLHRFGLNPLKSGEVPEHMVALDACFSGS